MLELLDMVPNVECRTSSVHRVHGDRGESGVYYAFDTVKPAISTEYRGHLQSRPAVKSLSSPDARMTTLTSSSKPTFSNT